MGGESVLEEIKSTKRTPFRKEIPTKGTTGNFFHQLSNCQRRHEGVADQSNGASRCCERDGSHAIKYGYFESFGEALSLEWFFPWITFWTFASWFFADEEAVATVVKFLKGVAEKWRWSLRYIKCCTAAFLPVYLGWNVGWKILILILLFTIRACRVLKRELSMYISKSRSNMGVRIKSFFQDWMD